MTYTLKYYIRGPFHPYICLVCYIWFVFFILIRLWQVHWPWWMSCILSWQGSVKIYTELYQIYLSTFNSIQGQLLYKSEARSKLGDTHFTFSSVRRDVCWINWRHQVENVNRIVIIVRNINSRLSQRNFTSPCLEVWSWDFSPKLGGN